MRRREEREREREREEGKGESIHWNSYNQVSAK